MKRNSEFKWAIAFLLLTIMTLFEGFYSTSILNFLFFLFFVYLSWEKEKKGN